MATIQDPPSSLQQEQMTVSCFLSEAGASGRHRVTSSHVLPQHGLPSLEPARCTVGFMSSDTSTWG